jgi:hypothetical protein
MLRTDQLKIGIITAFIVETLCATYFLDIPRTAAFFSVIYFIAGIAISILILFFPRVNASLHQQGGTLKLVTYIKPLLVIAFAGLVLFTGKAILAENPLDYKNADMLPVIKTMNERFLAGDWHHVYDDIPQIWNGSKPIYLPFMWLPYAPAVALHIDLRWITILSVILIFSLCIRAIQFNREDRSYLPVLVVCFVLFSWVIFSDEDHGFLSFSEEGVVGLFYMILVFALVSKNIVVISVAICLCMMSRYSAIGFVPAFYLYLLLTKKKKEAIILSITGFVFIIFFFILPFGWQPLERLIKLPGNYINFSAVVWKDSPEVFTEGLGFARFFVPGRMPALHAVLIFLAFVVPILFVTGCFYYKRRINFYNVPLASMKIALVVFYSFIDVPYLYLFYTSSFVSIAMLALLIRRQDDLLSPTIQS